MQASEQHLWPLIISGICRLAQSHLDKGDTTSAMVTWDWTQKRGFYQRWALPAEQAALLYHSLDRLEEARDTARLALRQPWWTAGHLEKWVSCMLWHCRQSTPARLRFDAAYPIDAHAASRVAICGSQMRHMFERCSQLSQFE